MTERLAGDPDALLSVLVSVAGATVAMCLVLLVLVRLAGARSLATSSTVDLVCMVALGAVVGRTTLLASPTLVAGITAVVLLFALQRGLQVLGRRRRWARLLGARPVVLMSAGRVHDAALRSSRVTHDDLRRSLRLAGVTQRGQVRLAVLEPTGSISVVCGDAVDDWLIHDLDLPPQHQETTDAADPRRDHRRSGR